MAHPIALFFHCFFKVGGLGAPPCPPHTRARVGPRSTTTTMRTSVLPPWPCPHAHPAHTTQHSNQALNAICFVSLVCVALWLADPTTLCACGTWPYTDCRARLVHHRACVPLVMDYNPRCDLLPALCVPWPCGVCALPCVAFVRVAALTQIAALVWYVICDWVFTKSFVLNFVVAVVLLALDFWTVRRWALAGGARSRLHRQRTTLATLHLPSGMEGS